MSKAHHPVARVILGTGAILALVSTAAAQTAVCAKPTPGLKAGQGSVYATTDAFWEGSQKYPIDIFSDIAPLGGPLFCALYEVENISGRDIARFSWPLASDMDLEVFPHQGPD